MDELPNIPDGYIWRWSEQNLAWYLFEERNILPAYSITAEMLRDTEMPILQALVDKAIYDDPT